MNASCIIPAKNREDMVIDAVESVLIQTLEEIEIIVVNDGSTDNTAENVRSAFPQVKLISTPGIGPGPARNTGARAACGEILMFLDSDDIWLSNHAEALLKTLRKGYQVAYGVTYNINCMDGSRFHIPDLDNAASGDCFSQLARWCFIVPSSIAITRKAFETTGGFAAGSMGEDWNFFIRLSDRFHFGLTREIITIRRLHRDSLCHIPGRTDQLKKAVTAVRQALETSRRTSPGDIERLIAVERLITEEGHKWQTVQDWYTSMTRQGLL